MFANMDFSLGAGGGNTAISKILPISANTNAEWDNIPFMPSQVFLIDFTIYNGNLYKYLYTNFNPSTGEVDNTKCWTSEDNGNTWTNDEAVWTITPTSVVFRPMSGVVTTYNVFVITDGTFELG